MATTKKATDEVVEVKEVKESPEDLVPFMASISRENQQDIFVSVNGENCLIQRGKQVMIKRKFYDVLMQSQAMDNLALERTINLTSES